MNVLTLMSEADEFPFFIQNDQGILLDILTLALAIYFVKYGFTAVGLATNVVVKAMPNETKNYGNSKECMN